MLLFLEILLDDGDDVDEQKYDHDNDHVNNVYIQNMEMMNDDDDDDVGDDDDDDANDGEVDDHDDGDDDCDDDDDDDVYLDSMKMIDPFDYL